MTINQKIFNFIKTTFKIRTFFTTNSSKIISHNTFLLVTIIIFLTLIYFISDGLVQKSNERNKDSLNKITNSSEFLNLTSYFTTKIKSPYKENFYVIKNNDSIEKILKSFQIKESDIKIITQKLKQKKLTNIYSGRKLSLISKQLADGSNTIIQILFPINNTISVEIRKNQDSFTVKENILKLYKKEVVVKNTIKNNLYNSAIEKNIEPNIIVEFARVFGFEVDFQRDIRKGDWFEILYEKFEDDNNKVRDTGKIIYASMSVNNEQINLYNFKYNKVEDYFDIKGKSITKSLMKTPINGARLSSSYGMRKHPILGYNRMHRGTDFAAPSGTPIMASGSGTVTRARWCGGGGNCVKIKHNSTYQTVYAHMKAFAKGVREGRKVKQGQIIGYVGSTGMSTGPHLHYEVIVNGKKVNSQKLKLPSGKILKGEERNKFELDRIKIDLKLAKLR